ncbi:MAG: ferritin family protein [Anaerolineae bacterium]
MKKDKTVAQLFELAIHAEYLFEEMYEGLARKFGHYPEVADFWTVMSREERGHAHALKQIRDDLEAAQLQAPADPEVFAQAQAAQQIVVEDTLARITNLQQAYEIVSAYENGETNAVFEFLITRFSVEPGVSEFLRKQLGEHLMHLMRDFPEPFTTTARRRDVEALDLSDEG